MARQLIATRPELDAQLCICSESLGLNAKVSTLIQLFRHVAQERTPGPSQEGNRLWERGERLPSLGGGGGGLAGSSKPSADQIASRRDGVFIISDADVHVPPDF